MITWRVVNSTSTSLAVELLQRHTWLWSLYPCNDTQIAAGNYMIGSVNLVCLNSCPSTISTLSSVIVPCTAYNIPELFTSGERRTQVRIPMNSRFTAIFRGSGWFALVQAGGNWSVAVQINTYLRSNGKYNQAPIVTMLPIIRLNRNRTYNIRINVADNDFDPYQCLWSTALDECGSVCMAAPNMTVLNSNSCIITFTPPQLGYYAIALTIVDYETTTSTNQLSRVPIQFLFEVWDSNNSCALPPLYRGDAPADECIYVEPGNALVLRILIKIQCPNATLDNIIGVYPVGLTRLPTYLDTYDPSINIFMINYTASVEEIGQNLFCFAAVDSIGNQADTACLRFTVQQNISSMNTLYLLNATRYPTGTVTKSQSIWTLIYPNGFTYSRPIVDAYIRFKYTSSQLDFLVIDIATSSNVDYQSDRLVITPGVTFTSGESFYIAFDPGVFLAISSCLRDSMGITDPLFWNFNIPSEPSTTSPPIPTTTTTQTTTLRIRTSPVLRTISSSSIPSMRSLTASSTLANIWMNPLTTTQRIPVTKKGFPISGIVGILIGYLLLIVCLITLKHLFPKIKQMCIKPSSQTKRSTTRQSLAQILNYDRVATSMNRRKSRKYIMATIDESDESQERIETTTSDRRDSVIISNHLVEIEC